MEYFKVGDTVRRIGSSKRGMPTGFVGVVAKLSETAGNRNIQFDGISVATGAAFGYWDPQYFELVSDGSVDTAPDQVDLFGLLNGLA